MVKVAQCWDDGSATDFRLVEILRKHNAKATFNLCPGQFPEKTISSFWTDPTERKWSHMGFMGGRVGKNDLKEVYDGFQVASHCWNHETAGTVPDDVFLKAAVDARNYLEDFFQQECPGFAWPNGRYTPETAKMLAEAGFRYGRTVTNYPDIMDSESPMMFSSNCHFNHPNFWNLFDEAKKTSYFYFWGHSYELLDYPVLWERFDAKIKALSEDPDVEWVDVIDLAEIMHKKV